MKTSRLAVLLSLAFTLSGGAATFTIFDSTPGTATRDGTVTAGEYVGSTLGVNQGSGDVIGAASRLSIDSDVGGTISMGLQSAGINNFGIVVIYIDSQPGGLNDTTTINNTPGGNSAISGNGSSGEASEITFAPGFFLDYAVSVEGGSALLWRISSDGTVFGSGNAFITRNNLFVWEISFGMASIGMSANTGQSFKYVASLFNNTTTANRSNEFQGISDTTVVGSGANPVNLAAGDFNTFITVPEPSSMSLLAGSIFAIICARRRRR